MKQEKPILLKINGVLCDAAVVPAAGDQVEEIFATAPEATQVYRHSCAHLLAQAVTELYPSVQYGVGPAVEAGFYYDFLTVTPFTPEDLENISRKMDHLAKQNLPVERLIWTKQQAIDYFNQKGQTLKLELLHEKVSGDEVSVYRQGGFVDMCRGPHLPSTGQLKHFKLLSVAAAYWKGDETKQSMQRIYGVVFASAAELADHLRFLKEAKERDHRKVGRELDLFSIQDEVGPGLVLWHPKGALIRHEIEKYWKDEHLKCGYDLLYSPHIALLDLWQTSGHTGFYSANMYTPIEFENTRYQLKPMNCPFHIEVFKARNRSYRDLPLRWAELGTVYRYERSGVLHGLLRVRGFTQDDAHIFCTTEQLESELVELIRFNYHILNTYGFTDYAVFLSTRPKEFVGEPADWDMATAALENALKVSQIPYTVDPGEGVFYGPKIDIKIRDVLGRYWQCTTMQIDFNLPKRFNLKYSDAQGNVKTPIMIHRALMGSLERFFGILIEHYAGFFPMWLAPVQVKVIPITQEHDAYAQSVFQQLRAQMIRAELESRSEGIGKKIRDAEMAKIPFIVIVGDKEQAEQNVSYRIHKQGDQGKIELVQLIEKIKKLIEVKSLNYEI